MNNDQLKAHFAEVDPEDKDIEAWCLLRQNNPTAERRFKRLTKGLIDLMEEIKAEFPDAEYYTGSGGLNLLIGSSHDARGGTGSENPHYVALTASEALYIGDGGF